MDAIEMPMKWMGRNIEELSREELIAALRTAGKLYHDLLESSIKSSKFMRELRESA